MAGCGQYLRRPGAAPADGRSRITTVIKAVHTLIYSDDPEAAATLEVPGADPIMVYEPRHPEAYDL